jgi:D-beta-D-heptose 7-phosphate kinase/D-beta-D-heptose 1-phosphate adenosyltransferase
LVVALNSDASVRGLKGAGRPLLGEEARAEMLAALEMVDYVTLFSEPTPLATIQLLKPDVLVKGEDWRDKGVVGREFVESYGGRVVLVPLAPGYSTTDILKQMRQAKDPKR